MRSTKYGIEGREISGICVDYAVTLQTHEGAELRIKTGFAVAASEAAAVVAAEPTRLGSAGAKVLTLIRQRVVAATIHDSGRLELRFDGGGRLLCEPDEKFEAWTLSAPDGERLVCLPGGGLAHWD